MDELKIEKDIPIPPTIRKKWHIFEDMEVGDSVLVDFKDANKARAALSNYRGEYRFVTRAVKSGLRVWKTEQSQKRTQTND